MEISGLVTRLTPFNDNDAIVNVLTLDFTYSFLARGVLKVNSKNKASVQPYTKSHFILGKSKSGYSLRTGFVLEAYQNAKKSLEGLVTLSFLGEVTNKALNYDESRVLYPFLEKGFILLDKQFHPLTVALIYLANVLKVIGLELEVRKCVISKQTSDICAVSLLDGGLISKSAFDPLKHNYASERKIKIYRQIFLAKLEDMDRVAFLNNESLEILNELTQYLRDNAGIYLKSTSFLNETFK